MTAPLGKSRTEKHVLAGICAALLLIAASRGYSQPTPHVVEWFEREEGAAASGIAPAAKSTAVDKQVLPDDSESGSLLDKFLELIGIGSSADPAAQDSDKSARTATRHVDRVYDSRNADVGMRVAVESVSPGKGVPKPEETGDLPQPGRVAAMRQRIEDEKLASRDHGPWSWLPQFRWNFWETNSPPEESPEMHMSELDIFILIALAGLGVLGFLVSRSKV